MSTPDPAMALAPGADVVVKQVKYQRPGVEYPAEVVHCDGRHLAVVATWVQEVDLGFVVFEPGDQSIEHYWNDRWFAVFQVHHHASRAIKGWYCNIARPVEVHGTTVTSVDLELDLWVPGDGGPAVRLDEDEFASSGLARRDPAAATAALAAFDRLEARGAPGLRRLLAPSCREP